MIGASTCVQVGYRYYHAHGLTPKFPFGHGLSFTSFAYSNLRVEQQTEAATGGEILISVSLSPVNKSCAAC